MRHISRPVQIPTPGPQAGRAGSRPETGGSTIWTPRGPTSGRLESSRRILIRTVVLLRSMPDPWRLSGPEATKLSPAIERALGSGWTARVSWLTCHEVQRECGTPPRSLHGDLLSSQRHRARRSDVACLGAASAKTISRGPSPSHCPTEPRRRHSARAAVLKRGHARSAGTYPISAQ